MSERANPVDPLLASELLAHHGFVRALARRLVSDAAAADDVAQDSMARLLEVGRPSSLRPFLRTVVTNVARRFGRRERRRIEVESASAAGPRATAPAAAELAQRLELQRRLTERVLALAPPMRDVVLLHFYEGKTVAETAEELAIPLETARTRLRRALAELRERWNGDLGGDREGLAALALLARWTPAKALVATAAATAAAASPWIWTGVFVMTAKAKVAAAAVVLAAAAAGTFVLWSDAHPPVPPRMPAPSAAAPFVDTEGADGLAHVRAATADAPKRESERAPLSAPATPATLGTLNVHVRFARDHSAAVGITTIVRRSGGEFRVDVERVRTDSTGTARFEGLAAGRVYVHSDRADGGKTAAIRAGESTELDLEIPLGLNVTGVVVDPSGAPVADALVEVAPLAESDRDAEVVATTDEEGRFDVRDAPIYCLIGARAAGFTPSSLTYIPSVAGNEADVRLELGASGGSVEGLVVGPDAQPVANAVVVVGRGTTSGIFVVQNAAPPLPALVRSDEHGHFLAVGVPTGSQPVVARARGLAPFEARCDVSAEKTTSLRIELTAGATVRGVVRDAAGHVVAGVGVSVGRLEDFVHSSTRTSAEGLFELVGLPAADVAVRAEHDEAGRGEKTVHAVAGEVVACDLVISRGLELKGRVIDERRLPVPFAFIFSPDMPTQAPVHSDGDGRFAIPNCDPSRRWTLNISGEEIETTWRHDVDPKAGEIEIVVHRNLPATARIVGVVVSPEGTPVANANVYALGTTPVNSTLVWPTDTAGRFELGPFPPGAWQVVVQRPDFPLFKIPPHEVAANATWDAGTIRLVAGGWANVTVEGDRTDVRFQVVDAAETTYSELVPVADLPRLKSEALAPGEHRLLVYGGKVAARSIPFTIRAGLETPIQLELATGVRQDFEFALASGIALDGGVHFRLERDGALVLAYSLVVPATRSCTDEVWLAPGDYEAIATADGHAGRVRFQIGAEPRAAVHVDVK